MLFPRGMKQTVLLNRVFRIVLVECCLLCECHRVGCPVA